MIFDDRLVQKGESGGKEAASMLWSSIRDYVHQRLPSLSSDYKIVTRIYANLKGLGDICHRSGILERSTLIEEFARGFTGSKQLFDFVDVGSGKDRADDKISGEILQCIVSSASHVFMEMQKYSNFTYMIVIVAIYSSVALTITAMLDYSRMLPTMML